MPNIVFRVEQRHHQRYFITEENTLQAPMIWFIFGETRPQLAGFTLRTLLPLQTQAPPGQPPPSCLLVWVEHTLDPLDRTPSAFKHRRHMSAPSPLKLSYSSYESKLSFSFFINWCWHVFSDSYKTMTSNSESTPLETRHGGEEENKAWLHFT